MRVMAADEDMDEDDSLTLIDELEKSTLSVADESSVEFNSSTTLEELSTARTSLELPKSPKSSKSAIFSDSEQAINAATDSKNAKFFINPPPKSRNNHSYFENIHKLFNCIKKNEFQRKTVAKFSFCDEKAQIIEK